MTDVALNERTVADLEEILLAGSPDYSTLKLGDVAVEGRTLHIGDRDMHMDDNQLDTLGQFFKIPRNYLGRLPEQLVTDTFGFFLDGREDDDAIFEFAQGDLNAVYIGNEALGHRQLAELIGNVMEPDARLADVWTYGGFMRVDVVTTELAVEPREGDITHGGLRFEAHVSPLQSRPYERTFLERLVCSNGMTCDETLGQINIKGNTVPDIIAEMELAAHQLLAGVPDRLEQWSSLADVPVDSAEQMIHRLSREGRVPATLESAIIGRVPELEGDTLYDVVNLMTSMHSVEGVMRNQVDGLQAMAGRVISDGGDHRCPRCASNLLD